MSCLGFESASGAREMHAASNELELGVNELGKVDFASKGSLRRVYKLFKNADTDGNGKVSLEFAIHTSPISDPSFLSRGQSYQQIQFLLSGVSSQPPTEPHDARIGGLSSLAFTKGACGSAGG